MISVILYGRNDSYGYNLHKRAALSFNCIAQLLDAPDDEILFVDYNTPDDYPTFPEAIRDTLSLQAKRLLRILRVRPAQHRRFQSRSHLVALEPVARNVAVQRANAANRWLLSTNTDMIFVPRTGRSLSAIAAPLADGYYHLPRFEIPESLWETLDRADPAGSIARVGEWGWRFHLNDITDHEIPYIKYDAPGDFQLILRRDAHRIWGFDERMLVGYHVDSNIAARLYQLHGQCGDVLDDLFGYHCDHTRQITPAHKHGSVENDAKRFVMDINDPLDARDQAASWGLAGETVEEVRLDGGRVTYLGALDAVLTEPMQAPTRLLLGQSSIERTDYEAAHVLPFLLDALVEYPRDTVLGWFGTRADLLGMFAQAWQLLGFTAPILVSDAADWLGPTLPAGAAWQEPQALLGAAHAFVLDGGLPIGHDPAELAPHKREVRHVIYALRAITHAEQQLAAQHGRPDADTLPPHLRVPRRIIAVNAFLNTWELTVRDHVGAAKSPGSTRIRQGFALPAVPHTIAVLAQLSAGPAGRITQDGIRIRPWLRGFVCAGPYLQLMPGRYRLEITLQPDALPRPGPLKLEVVRQLQPLARRYFVMSGFARRVVTLDFTIGDTGAFANGADAVEFRLATVGLAGGRISAANLHVIPIT